jgi:hypothetical protein
MREGFVLDGVHWYIAEQLGETSIWEARMADFPFAKVTPSLQHIKKATSIINERFSK